MIPSNADDDIFLRRTAAAQYLKSRYGFGTPKSLAKYASVGGGPEYQYIGSLPLYRKSVLDRWALSRLSKPVRNTSEARRPAA